jgi:hypothetical protein
MDGRSLPGYRLALKQAKAIDGLADPFLLNSEKEKISNDS